MLRNSRHAQTQQEGRNSANKIKIKSFWHRHFTNSRCFSYSGTLLDQVSAEKGKTIEDYKSDKIVKHSGCENDAHL